MLCWPANNIGVALYFTQQQDHLINDRFSSLTVLVRPLIRRRMLSVRINISQLWWCEDWSWDDLLWWEAEPGLVLLHQRLRWPSTTLGHHWPWPLLRTMIHHNTLPRTVLTSGLSLGWRPLINTAPSQSGHINQHWDDADLSTHNSKLFDTDHRHNTLVVTTYESRVFSSALCNLQ